MNRARMRYTAYYTLVRSHMRNLLPAQGLKLIPDDDRLRWSDRLLVTGAILMFWFPSRTWREAFAAMRETLVSMYPTRRRPGTSLSGFLKALRDRSASLMVPVMRSLQQRTKAVAGRQWRWKGWALMGADGSRVNSPRTKANEDVLRCAGKTRTAPQQLLMLIYHVATGLPWTWRRSSGDGSERHMLQDALPELPEKTLLLADAGFMGFELMRQIVDAGHDFIIRVGANVTLLKELGYDMEERGDTVYLWPLDQQRKNPPMALRLVQFGCGGKRMSLLTSVFDKSKLSRADVKALYRQRWSIEVMFRAFKQTLGHRTLRAQTPELAGCELDWALIGMWMLGLMTLQVSPVKSGWSPTGTKWRWSPAGALDAIRTALRQRQRRVGLRQLQKLLRAAVPDPYRRTGPKTARDWPHKKHDHPPGNPKIRTPSDAEIRKIKAIREEKTAA